MWKNIAKNFSALRAAISIKKSMEKHSKNFPRCARSFIKKNSRVLKNFPRCARQKQIGFFRPTQGFSAAGKIKI